MQPDEEQDGQVQGRSTGGRAAARPVVAVRPAGGAARPGGGPGVATHQAFSSPWICHRAWNRCGPPTSARPASPSTGAAPASRRACTPAAGAKRWRGRGAPAAPAGVEPGQGDRRAVVAGECQRGLRLGRRGRRTRSGTGLTAAGAGARACGRVFLASGGRAGAGKQWASPPRGPGGRPEPPGAAPDRPGSHLRAGDGPAHPNRGGQARIVRAILSRERGRWSASVTGAMEREPRSRRLLHAAVGVDAGMRDLAVLSTGEEVRNPPLLRTVLLKPARFNRESDAAAARPPARPHGRIRCDAGHKRSPVGPHRRDGGVERLHVGGCCGTGSWPGRRPTPRGGCEPARGGGHRPAPRKPTAS